MSAPWFIRVCDTIRTFHS